MAAAGFLSSLTEWSFTICPTLYSRKQNVLNVSLNKTFLLPYMPLSYFLFQPVLHDWFNKGRGMCFPVCVMVSLIGKSSPCRGGSGFPLSLSGPLPHVRSHINKISWLSSWLKRTFHSFPSKRCRQIDPSWWTH